MDKAKSSLYEYRDSSGIEHSIAFEKTDFNLSEGNKNIHDQKLKTKPTTFFKDAFKRFLKNKSSVVGACILGVLLVLSVVVPLIDQTPLVDNPHPKEAFLEPKLFDTGTGFWDGTKKMTDIPCNPNDPVIDETTGTVKYYPNSESFPKSAISNLSEPRRGFTDTATTYAANGFARLTTNLPVITGDDEEIESKKGTLISPSFFTFNVDNEYDLSFTVFTGEDEEITFGSYRAYISYTETITEEQPVLDEEGNETGEVTEEEVAQTSELVLLDYNDVFDSTKGVETKGTIDNEIDPDSPFSVSTYEFTDILSDLREKKDVKDISIKFDVLPQLSASTSLLLHDLTVSSNDSSEATRLNTISFSDANKFVMLDSKSQGYWSGSNLSKGVYKAIALVCDFTFDTYEAAYGIKEETITDTVAETYVSNGWINAIDWEAFYASGSACDVYFENYIKNDQTEEKCPIVSVVSVTATTAGDKTSYSILANVSYYKYLGYSSMPKFIAGTDGSGYNLFTEVFVGLRNSLGLGILTFVICFTFGLIFGAICGYYGGTVDIILQRLVDILSGVPWIVIMTLCILHLGTSFSTFILAMCMTGWISTSSITRTQFYRYRDREYTLASRTLGANDIRLIFRHILPNAMGTIITSSVLMIPSVIFTEATISYLGLGFKNMVSLGVILSTNQQYLSTYPTLILFPSVIMALIMICFNLFGNGLRDAFNPSLKGSD